MKKKFLHYDPKLIKLAQKLRQEMTLAEILLWEELKQRKMLGYHFQRQRPIDKYIVDFYCKELMLAIEVDGSSHDLEGQYDKDLIRQENLEQLGVRFLRFDDRDVLKDMDNVLSTIAGWIREYTGKG